MLSLFPDDKEPVPRQDVSGIAVTAPNNSAFKPRDEVYCRIHADHPGGARGYTLVREGELSLKPKTLNWSPSTAVPLSTLTAFQTLFIHRSLDFTALFSNGAAKKQNTEKYPN